MMDEFALGVAAGMSFALILIAPVIGGLIGALVALVGIFAFGGSLYGLHVNRQRKEWNAADRELARLQPRGDS